MKRVLRYLVPLTATCFVSGLRSEPLPIETFFRPPSLSGMQIAPDGKHLAAVSFQSNHCSLLISDLETGKRAEIVKADVWAFAWLNNRRLFCWAGGPALFGGAFAINIDGTQEKVLQKPFLTQAFRGGSFAYTTLRVLQWTPEWPDSILAERTEITSLTHEHPPEVGRLNYFTGEWTREEKNPGNVVAWLADPAGHVRAAVAVEKDIVKLLYRASQQQPWKVVHQSGREENDLFPRGFAPDGTRMYVATHNGSEFMGLYKFDLEAGNLAEELWRSPSADLAGLVMSGERAQAVLFEEERPRLTFLDPALGRVQAQMDAALPDTFNFPVNSSRDGQKVVYLCTSDRDPGTYYLANRSRGEFGIIGRTAPWIDPARMAKVKPIEYETRDGTIIQGYLTLPPGSAGTNLPMVVAPHGGPGVRNHWEFDPEVQFFANRGYAVLQMNFRGSTGYGLSFWRAGFRQWGGKMQDDLTDGVRWAISQGIADPSRIGIFGASYGGYAALTGLIKTPELFRCAISYVGVTDVRAITRRSYLEGQARKDFDRAVREEVGDYRADKKELEAISPTHLVDGIKVPVLLAYGGRDPIVPVEQGYTLAEALKKQHKTVELIVEKNEGHGFRTLAARTNLFHRIELFLAENLGN